MSSRKVGTAEARPGQMSRGVLTLGWAPDGPVQSEVTIAAGRHPGPTLWIQALVHGQEVGGTLALGRFLKRLNLETLRGTVIALPVANPLAYRAWSRNLPVDGFNLNRVFPGSPTGTHTEQVAHTLLTTAMESADVIVDIHSGGERSHVPHYALVWAEGPASAESLRLARAAATPDLWVTTDGWLRGAMFTLATQHGKPAVIVECGGGAAVPEAHIEAFLASLTGICQALGMLEGDPPRQASYRIMGKSDLIFSTRGGLFVAACKPGDVVQKGQELGRLIDVWGDVLEVVHAPYGPAYIASIRRTHHALHSGEQVAEVIHVVEGA